ncbi:hypothetical protein ACE1SV_67160 [Streptomyces sp. E-15]
MYTVLCEVFEAAPGQRAAPAALPATRYTVEIRRRLAEAVADEGCGYADEGQEVVGLSLVAAVQPAASGQPGDRSFDDPAVSAEPRGGLDALAGDAVADATPAKSFPQVVVVVALVGG